MAYSKNFSIEELRFDNNGLIPAIAQDWLDGSVLMFAWMNKESLKKSWRAKPAHPGLHNDTITSKCFSTKLWFQMSSLLKKSGERSELASEASSPTTSQ